MSTILLRIQSVLQSWGYQGGLYVKDTGRYPTKSGIIGLCCAAIGKPRVEPAPDFPTLVEMCGLRMGVRVISPGIKKRDFCTAGGGISKPIIDTAFKDKKTTRDDAVLLYKYYLMNADFLVALEGDTSLLERIRDGFLDPVYSLYFGRKCCIPSRDILVRLSDSSLGDVLKSPGVGDVSDSDLFVLDDVSGSIVLNDVPLSLSSRKFGSRRVVECSFGGL